MRRVAARVGAGTMSLYRYVASKDELVELMIDAVTGEYELPDGPSGDWRSDLAGLARQQRQILHRHPWATQAMTARLALGPNVLRYMEFALAVLDQTGMELDETMEVIGLLNGLVAGFVAAELAEEQYHAAREPYLRSIVESGDFPLVSRAIATGLPRDADLGFGRSVNRFLDGVAATLPPIDSRRGPWFVKSRLFGGSPRRLANSSPR